MKLKIDHQEMLETFFADTMLVGIVTPLPDYRFMWFLKERLDMPFRLSWEEEIEIVKNKTTPVYFNVYTLEIGQDATNYVIYSLKTQQPSAEKSSGKEAFKQREKQLYHLLPELKNMDFLWKIQSMKPKEKAEEIIALLKQLPEIQIAKEIRSEEIKSIQNLVL